MTKSMHVYCIVYRPYSRVTGLFDQRLMEPVHFRRCVDDQRREKHVSERSYLVSVGSNTAETMNDLQVICQTYRPTCRTRTRNASTTGSPIKQAPTHFSIYRRLNFITTFFSARKTILCILPCTRHSSAGIMTNGEVFSNV